MRRLLPSAVLNITRRLGKESVLRPLDVPVQELVLGLCPTYAHLVLSDPTRSLDAVHGTCASRCATRQASILTPLFSGLHARDACAISFSIGHFYSSTTPAPHSEMADTDTSTTKGYLLCRAAMLFRKRAVWEAPLRVRVRCSTLEMRTGRGWVAGLTTAYEVACLRSVTLQTSTLLWDLETPPPSPKRMKHEARSPIGTLESFDSAAQRADPTARASTRPHSSTTAQHTEGAHAAPGPRTSPPTKSASFWYPDGSIVIKADATYYKLHSSRLARYCVFFQKLFADDKDKQ